MISWVDSEPIVLGDIRVSARQVIELLSPQLTEERRARLDAVVAHRSDQVVPILENIYDRGNVSAVMRSAEAFGFYDFRVVENPNEKFKPANRVTAGTEKWLKVTKFQNIADCIGDLRQRGFKIFATHLEAAVPIDNIDFTQPTAFILGNEKDGVSREALDLVDGRFLIPMQGFAQSFNISVAGALCFHHAFKERERKMGEAAFLNKTQQELLLANYILRSVAHPEEILLRKLQND